MSEWPEIRCWRDKDGKRMRMMIPSLDASPAALKEAIKAFYGDEAALGRYRQKARAAMLESEIRAALEVSGLSRQDFVVAHKDHSWPANGGRKVSRAALYKATKSV